MNVPGWERVGRGSRADVYLMLALLAFVLWTVVSIIWVRDHLSLASSHLAIPPLLAVGVLVGRWQAASSRRWIAPVAAAVLGLAALFAVPFYANAQAALGIQLVALAFLLLLTSRVDRRRGVRASILVVLAAGVGALGVLLAARSQAASILVLPVVLVSAFAVCRRPGPPRRAVMEMGLLPIGVAAIAVISLGSFARWPEALSAGESLSSVRHELWSDALALWRQNPVLGGGTGSFVQHSQIAASRSDLAPVHSSILQVGAELGAVGAVLFLGILVAGAAVTAHGDGPRAIIATSAWSALAVHSMIDHLYEFPVVTLVAGFVLGFAGRARGSRGSDARPMGSGPGD